eukprot:3937408-Rhodomonas_salina.2
MPARVMTLPFDGSYSQRSRRQARQPRRTARDRKTWSAGIGHGIANPQPPPGHPAAQCKKPRFWARLHSRCWSLRLLSERGRSAPARRRRASRSPPGRPTRACQHET